MSTISSQIGQNSCRSLKWLTTTWYIVVQGSPHSLLRGGFCPHARIPQGAPFISKFDEWVGSLQWVWKNVKRALAKATESQKIADKRWSPQGSIMVREKVYLSTKYLKLRLTCKKLGPKYIGPFPIIKVINPVTVELKLPWLLGKVHPVFHCSLLKPVVGSRLRPAEGRAPRPVLVEGEEHYEIKKILDSRLYNGKLQYLVQCKGYPMSEAHWVKAQNIRADWLVKRFHKKYPQKPGTLSGRGRENKTWKELMYVLNIFQIPSTR